MNLYASDKLTLPELPQQQTFYEWVRTTVKEILGEDDYLISYRFLLSPADSKKSQ
jgi:hypothetical protein